MASHDSSIFASILAKLNDIGQRLERLETLQADPSSSPARLGAPTPRTTHLFDALWCDARGVYVRGWAHAYHLPILDMFLESGEARVRIPRCPRPDLLAFWPDWPHVVDSGFAVHLACPPFQPVRLRLVTADGEAMIEVSGPTHADPYAVPSGDQAAVTQRFIEAMRASHGQVLEIGGRTITQPSVFRQALEGSGCRYIGFDIHPAPGVDIVGDAHALSRYVAPGSLDGVCSLAVLEHLEAPWLAAAEMNRALKVGGLVYHAVPQCWPIHELPNDFWRMSDEGLRVLFGPALGFEVLERGMCNPMAILPEPGLRLGPFLEMPFSSGFGTAYILARKHADIDDGAVRWPGSPDGLSERSRHYPSHGGSTLTPRGEGDA
ncbi:class I SAM-dependent methyltransferase [Azospirillum brasilense]|uniref:class I SAM-dependent methyltransferase n=1 Tax=Azospirillum brasilense TaxID=192 RepID=UPI001EDC658B|nr:methyltransferase domain-containing protein [Azospirillum brasilense]UKJ75998.1 class I SAM-dependent methyltransferase [Azospirillum brasilense]